MLHGLSQHKGHNGMSLEFSVCPCIFRQKDIICPRNGPRDMDRDIFSGLDPKPHPLTPPLTLDPKPHPLTPPLTLDPKPHPLTPPLTLDPKPHPLTPYLMFYYIAINIAVK